MKPVVPWILKCHDCGREFGLSGGGLCKKCGRPTCNKCLGVGIFRRIQLHVNPEQQVCRTCIRSEAAESPIDNKP